jgi:anti-sigma factor ChrR (cupin superfamily)
MDGSLTILTCQSSIPAHNKKGDGQQHQQQQQQQHQQRQRQPQGQLCLVDLGIKPIVRYSFDQRWP